MLRSNCHTHTCYCDGKNTPEEMVQGALARGFSCLGFSMHAPMKSGCDWTISAEKLPAYLAEIRRLQAKYAGQIELLNGIELDRLYCDTDPASFDYVIGAMHQISCGGRHYDVDYTAEHLQHCCDLEFGGDFLRLAEKYYADYTSFLCEQKPQIAAHFDLIEKFNENGALFNSEDPRYRALAEEAADRVLTVCPEILFEVNTGAMFRCGKRFPYPMPFLLRHLAERGARVIVTSDAHCPEALDFAFETALAVCRESGFRQIFELRKSGFVPVEIK